MKKLIKMLPFSIKQYARYFYGAISPRIRYGKVFWETYSFLQKSQWWSRKELEEYQLQQLSKLLHYAYENVPYYRRVFQERGLKPKDIQKTEDLKKLPYLTKDIFKEHFGEFVAKNFELSSLHTNHTSGSTGKPLQFYENSECTEKEWAFVCHQWAIVGYKPGDKRVELRGSLIRNVKPIEYNPISRVLRLSPRINNKEVVKYYLKSMLRFDASYLHGYPSTIAVFASMVKQYGMPVPFNLKAVLFASEAVYPWEREITQEVFNCRVFSHYGMAEKVVLAGECENSPYYHCLPQYGITEIDINSYEIIGTGFLNYATPFIRYRTTDVASQAVSLECKECNREYFPILPAIEGRIEDFIFTPAGVPISPAVITHPFKDLKTVKHTQIIQKTPDVIVLKVVPWDGCIEEELENELEHLRNGLRKILGQDVEIKTNIVEDIKLSSSGKFKWIISDIAKDFLEKGMDKI